MLVAYLRVSTNEQAESGLGLDAQLESITKAVGAPDQVYRDEGYSGSKENRPALLDALNTLKKGDTLAVAKRDRLARDSWLALSIERECQKRKVSIVSAAGEGNGDCSGPRNPRWIVPRYDGGMAEVGLPWVRTMGG